MRESGPAITSGERPTVSVLVSSYNYAQYVVDAVRSVDPAQAVFNVRMMDDVFDASVAPRRTKASCSMRRTARSTSGTSTGAPPRAT